MENQKIIGVPMERVRLQTRPICPNEVKRTTQSFQQLEEGTCANEEPKAEWLTIFLLERITEKQSYRSSILEPDITQASSSPLTPALTRESARLLAVIGAHSNKKLMLDSKVLYWNY
uniref:Uncharacterized protein n=1 Tax=Nelumbo nucifera TaxID=4432 RepID=A0A822ZSX5_NELNU|nr:TPA_asm: hypothetical protein HUJ06_016598 [Nelumbo nucifera]